MRETSELCTQPFSKAGQFSTLRLRRERLALGVAGGGGCSKSSLRGCARVLLCELPTGRGCSNRGGEMGSRLEYRGSFRRRSSSKVECATSALAKRDCSMQLFSKLARGLPRSSSKSVELCVLLHVSLARERQSCSLAMPRAAKWRRRLALGSKRGKKARVCLRRPMNASSNERRKAIGPHSPPGGLPASGGVATRLQFVSSPKRCDISKLLLALLSSGAPVRSL